jgi:hypothetical protein
MEWLNVTMAKVKEDLDAAEAELQAREKEHQRVVTARNRASALRNSLHTLMAQLRDLDNGRYEDEVPL